MDLSSLTPDQRSCVQHLDGPLLISAGAGSGKTLTLTQRLAYALLPGSGADGAAFLNSIDEALVITYTRKAAGEIKDRVRTTLRAEGMLDEALKVDSAWISTIHSMCERVLREHALEFGLDPAFSVVGGTEEEELRMQAIEAQLARESSENSVYAELFTQFKPGDIQKYLEEIIAGAQLLPAGMDAIDLGPEGTPLNLKLRALLEVAEQAQDGATDKARESLQTFTEQMNAYLQGPEDFSVANDILHLHLPAGNAVKEFNALVKQLRQEVLMASNRECTSLLVSLAREVDAEYQRLLEEKGQIDMSGLIRKTLSAFNEFPHIAEQYTSRFKLIMVDEFQDTSQLQIDMIECIAGAERSRLCTVGDAQQSIYRFQGADVSVYINHKHAMKEGGAKVVQLNDNFRSNKEVLSFVRKVCGQHAYFSEDFLDLQAQVEGRPYKASDARIEVVLAEFNSRRGDEAISRASALAAEVDYIAQRFSAFKQAGHSYSDMVLLLGRMTDAQLYAQAMRDAGLPCVVAGGSKFFDSEAVQICQDLVGALANPYDAGCLLSVLTSEVLPVTTDDLLFLSTSFNTPEQAPRRQNLALGFLREDAAPQQASPLLQHAQAVLERAWSKLGKVRPAQLLKETIIDTGWLARLEAGGPAEQAKAADILKFVRLVEEVEQEAAFDMARVAKEMRLRETCTQEKPGALSLENLDAVRIMTIHSSKGLEFPIVAVAAFVPSQKPHPMLSYSEDGKLFVSMPVSGFNASEVASEAGPAGARERAEFRANMLLAQNEKEAEERKRLFYVAATRASAALIISMCAPLTSTGYPAIINDILQGLLPGETLFPESTCMLDYPDAEPICFTRLNVVALEEEEESYQAAHPSTIAIPALPAQPEWQFVSVPSREDFFSYSSLREEDKAPHHEGQSVVARAEDEGSEDLPIPADADKATDFGSALHRVCEWYAAQAFGGAGTLASPSETETKAAIQRAANEFGVRDTGRVQAAFDRWVASEACQWAAGFETQQPELPFTIELDGRYLEGEIDLFCTTGTSAGIIDYKTGGHKDETPEQLYSKHLLQAQCYAYASLQAGFENVELRFVRLEQPDAGAAHQPQVVCYEFSQEDIASLHAVISEAAK